MSEPVFVDQLTELLKGEIRQELAFTNTEYVERVEQVREEMKKANVDLLMSTYLPNICYITGYQFTNCDYSGYLLLPSEGETTMVVPGTEVSTVLLHGWVRDVLDFPSWKPHEAAPLIADTLSKLGLDKGTVGIEKRFELMDELILEQIQELLPNLNFVDVSEMVIQLREVKSPTEIEHLRQAARYSDSGMIAARSCATPENSENDVAAAAINDMIRVGSEFFSTAPTVASGLRTSVPNAMFKRNAIEEGSPVEVQLAGAYQRYSAPLVRTFLPGNASDKTKELRADAISVLEVLTAAIAPGVKISDVAKVVTRKINKLSSDYWPSKSYGYSIGVGMPPSWIEEWLEIREENDKEFVVGMCFHSVISLRIPGEEGFSVGDSWVVTESGAETLSRLPLAM